MFCYHQNRNEANLANTKAPHPHLHGAGEGQLKKREKEGNMPNSICIRDKHSFKLCLPAFVRHREEVPEPGEV